MKLLMVTYMDITEATVDEEKELMFPPAFVIEVGWYVGDYLGCMFIKKCLNSMPLTNRVCCIPRGVIVDERELIAN